MSNFANLVIILARGANGQQNDFRARSVEDSWGHQAMRINRWSVMHRVWDGLFDLKNIEATNTLTEIDNYGNPREVSEQNQLLIDSFAALTEAEQAVADSQVASFEMQQQMNAAVFNAVVAQVNLSQKDREQQLLNMQDQLTINKQTGDVFIAGITSNRSEIYSNDRDIEKLAYQDQMGELNAIYSDLLIKRDYNSIESDYINSSLEDSAMGVELQRKYNTLSGKYAEKSQELQNEIHEHAVARMEARKKAEEALQNQHQNQLEHFKEVWESGNTSESSFYMRAQAAKKRVQQQLNAEFADIMSSVMVSYENDRMEYLDAYSNLMEEQKQRMKEANKERILIVQHDKQQMYENQQIIRRLVALNNGAPVKPEGASSNRTYAISFACLAFLALLA